MKTGILGGSFNPIHIGHLALANYLCEYAGLDELWFLVSPCSPLKEGTELLDDRLRLELVELSIAGYDKFRACDIEFRLPRPLYTVRTLDHLKRLYPDRTFHLIIGSDNWHIFSQWHDSARLLAENRLLVYPRPGYPVSADAESDRIQIVRHVPVFDISSTFIRQSLRDGKDIRYFLHPAVYERLKEAMPGTLPLRE
ncbi:MAG: nicotinate-nucleotide adenylyltransferase [Prevotellaceae bacterium]|jgi:nicotinate-nucleotide adenylyltransferase|nr:nicotinate-nucleotide adenylyltransferase [Prevotellaceae bacterium]